MSATWRSHSQALSDHLAYLINSPGPTDGKDLDVALHARSAVLGLVTAVHHDVSGLRSGRRPRVDDPDRYVHPVAHLGRVLDDLEQPRARRSLMESLSAPPQDRVGLLWTRIARDASLARHAWDAIAPADKVLGPAAWTVMHQLAQQAQALTWLDDDLASSCRDAGRDGEADLLRDSSTRLRPAAACVAGLAASGPLQQLPDLLAPEPRRALVVRSFEQTPWGVERLGTLLRSSDHVSPTQVLAGYRVLGRVVACSATLLASSTPLRLPGADRDAANDTLSGGDALAAAMAGHAEVMRRLAREPGRVRSLLPEDALVTAQVGQLALAVGDRQRPPLGHQRQASPGAVAEVCAQVAATSVQATFALEEVVTQSLQEEKWLVAAGERAPSALSWVPAERRHALLDEVEAPTLLRSAAFASARAERLARSIPAPAWTAGRPVTLRWGAPAAGGDLLGAALQDAERRAMPRPPRPHETGRRLRR